MKKKKAAPKADEIVKLFKSGLTVKQIAKKTKFSVSSIYRALRNSGNPIKQPKEVTKQDITTTTMPVTFEQRVLLEWSKTYARELGLTLGSLFWLLLAKERKRAER
jgi:transposase